MNARNVLTKAIKPVGIAGGLLIVYALAGFFLLPTILQSKIPAIIEEATGRKSSVDRIEFDPFLLRFSIKGFSMSEANGGPFVNFGQFYTDLNAFRSIGNAALVIDKIILSKPSVRLVKLKDGQFNFDSLVRSKSDAETEKKDEGGLFPLIIDKISLNEGKVGWFDQSGEKPRKEDISPISFEIHQLTTKESELFPMHLSFSVGSGGQLDWQGTTGIKPLSSAGKIKLDRMNLNRIQELAMPAADFELKGSGQAELDYRLSSTGKGLDLAIDKSRIELQEFGFLSKAADGMQVILPKLALESAYKLGLSGTQWRFAGDKTRLDLTNLQLMRPGNVKASVDIPQISLQASYQANNADSKTHFNFKGDSFTLQNAVLTELGRNEPLVKIPELKVSGIGLDLDKRAISVASVKTRDGDFKAWLDAQGKINFTELLPEAATADSAAPAGADKAAAPSEPWQISVNEFDASHFGLLFEDRSLKKTVTITAKPIDIKLTGASNTTGQKLPVHFSTGINETGTIKIDGDTVLEPFSASLSVAVNNIELEPFQPYVEPHARLDIMDGQLNVDGDLSLAMPDKKGLDLKFKGNTSIADLVTRDQILHRDFVKWKKLSVQDITADLLANHYTAKRLILNKPYARVTIKKDKTVNINDIFNPGEPKAAKSPNTTSGSKPRSVAATAQPKLVFRLDKFQIVDGASDFADLSLILPFAAPIQNLNGGASGISSERKSTVKVSMEGEAYELSPVDIKGEVSPFLGDFDVELNFTSMPMPLVSPYMAQFAGYKVEKGKLTLGLKYQVVNKQLKASNSILIDQFELGEKVENPNAVSLPLDLAVALLKDSNGKIKIDVPITGSLEDPKFSIGKVIADALFNTLTKIITSPFTAIASLIGSEENLDTVTFAPGQAVLNPEQNRKLDGLAKAMYDRPVLTLEVKGTAFREQDWPALREAALVDELKKMKSDEISKKGGKKILAEYVELSDEDYKRLLADKFIKEFPQMADKSILGTPRLIDPGAGDFYKVAREKLSQALKPDPNRLQDLATDRAQAIAKFIVKQRGIPDGRVYILDPVIDPDRKENKDVVSFLYLKAR